MKALPACIDHGVGDPNFDLNYASSEDIVSRVSNWQGALRLYCSNQMSAIFSLPPRRGRRFLGVGEMATYASLTAAIFAPLLRENMSRGVHTKSNSGRHWRSRVYLMRGSHQILPGCATSVNHPKLFSDVLLSTPCRSGTVSII